MYAGFWLRFLAYLVDRIVLFFCYLIFIFIWAGFEMVLITLGVDQPLREGILGILGVPIYLIIPWLYYAILESSKIRGTVGKMALELEVVDENNNTISFWRATGRYFSKFISALVLLLGFVLAGFTEKKQALHDLIANTYVIKKRKIIENPPLS